MTYAESGGPIGDGVNGLPKAPGCGAGCEICKDICKIFAWDMDPQGRVMLDQDKCLACGMCIHRCPNNNIEMVQTSATPI